MQSKSLTISNRLGMHARAAAVFVRAVAGFKSEVYVEKNGRKVDGKSIMDLMTLAATQGTVINVMTHGEDEDEALRVVAELVDNRFGEEE
ncbi:MAG: HPr family phosphocarrier protein [Nitrospirota bacterium]|nr:HPr family phosphocarrier protein [Nitrospirota bacterium]